MIQDVDNSNNDKPELSSASPLFKTMPKTIFRPIQDVKRKRSDSELESEEERIYKMFKAIIAQVALRQLDDDLDNDLAGNLDLALAAIEVLGIKIPLTYKEAINDPEHSKQ
jgi:hypothetical protein